MHQGIQRVLRMPSIVQRTPEWYTARMNLITASSCADAMGENPYDRLSRDKLILSKASETVEHVSNCFMAHGNRYEPLATAYFERIFSRKILDAGLLVHPNLPFIGASPDGLCPDDGHMLEIKCPMKRKIHKNGTIKGAICPHHYWIQVQVQLEVCDLEVCDFWQCVFTEFDTFEEWYEWRPAEDSLLVCMQPEPKEWGGLRKGVLVVLRNGKTIYPPRIFDTEGEWTSWVVATVASLGSPGDVKKLVFWRLDDVFNQPILRDVDWFNVEALPKLDAFWKEVLLLRERYKATGKRSGPSFFD